MRARSRLVLETSRCHYRSVIVMVDAYVNTIDQILSNLSRVFPLFLSIQLRVARLLRLSDKK